MMHHVVFLQVLYIMEEGLVKCREASKKYNKPIRWDRVLHFNPLE